MTVFASMPDDIDRLAFPISVSGLAASVKMLALIL
jgi:hypothetical protein